MTEKELFELGKVDALLYLPIKEEYNGDKSYHSGYNQGLRECTQNELKEAADIIKTGNYNKLRA